MTGFKVVERCTYKLNKLEKGCNQFIPVLFDKIFYYCVANMTFHATLIDFRFRLRPEENIMFQEEIK